jgi:hypothetical protein
LNNAHQLQNFVREANQMESYAFLSQNNGKKDTIQSNNLLSRLQNQNGDISMPIEESKLSPYEIQRLKNIERNKEMMKTLGLNLLGNVLLILIS